jgi:hypothetical protein
MSYKTAVTNDWHIATALVPSIQHLLRRVWHPSYEGEQERYEGCRDGGACKGGVEEVGREGQPSCFTVHGTEHSLL